MGGLPLSGLSSTTLWESSLADTSGVSTSSGFGCSRSRGTRVEWCVGVSVGGSAVAAGSMLSVEVWGVGSLGASGSEFICVTLHGIGRCDG